LAHARRRGILRASANDLEIIEEDKEHGIKVKIHHHKWTEIGWIDHHLVRIKRTSEKRELGLLSWLAKWFKAKA